ncbi:MAG: hypothetical protein V4722_24585 [Bacteroidota bacterium]
MIAENEQYESKESFYYLEICCRYVGEKYGNATISLWTNGDYVKLSGILSKHTDIQISASTLKRIFGKLKTNERYYPQKATRDALANYAGFADWETFSQKHARPVKTEQPKQQEADQKTEEPAAPAAEKIIPKKRSWWPVIGLLVAAITAISIWKFSEKEQPLKANTKGVAFICNNPEGENPHSAAFRMQLPGDFTGDTSGFTVDFNDGKVEKKIIPGSLLTHYYEIPGRYYPILKYNGLTVDTAFVYLKTNGWTATVTMERDTTRVYPVNNSNLFKNGKMLVNTKELLQAGVDTNHTFFVHFANTKPLNINADNFELIANVATSQLRPGVRCSQVNIELYGERSQHSIILIKPGCVSWVHLRFSEIFLDGETVDLSSIGTDLSGGGIIKLQVINKKVHLLVNEKLLYKTSYNFPLNKLYGVKISFAGIGTVNTLLLKDLNTGERFHDGF